MNGNNGEYFTRLSNEYLYQGLGIRQQTNGFQVSHSFSTRDEGRGYADVVAQNVVDTDDQNSCADYEHAMPIANKDSDGDSIDSDGAFVHPRPPSPATPPPFRLAWTCCPRRERVSESSSNNSGQCFPHNTRASWWSGRTQATTR